MLFVDGRYFVMLDDLAVSEAKSDGSLFSWLYHVLQDVPLIWNPRQQRFVYTIGSVNTVVQLIGQDVPIQYDNRMRDLGLINPLTGEDYNQWVRPVQLFDNTYTGDYPEKVTHNIWISNREPRKEMKFLFVIYPYRQGDRQPEISRIDDLTVEVSCAGETETITFDPARHPDADIQVSLDVDR